MYGEIFENVTHLAGINILLHHYGASCCSKVAQAERALVIGVFNDGNRSISRSSRRLITQGHISRQRFLGCGLSLCLGLCLGQLLKSFLQLAFFRQSDCFLKQFIRLGTTDWESIDKKCGCTINAKRLPFIQISPDRFRILVALQTFTNVRQAGLFKFAQNDGV